MRDARKSVGFLAGALLVLALAGCTPEPMAEEYGGDRGDGYQSPDGRFVEFASADRGDPVEFEAQSDTGSPVSSADYTGSVLVVNFWYANCGPCRAEASDLERLYQQHLPSGVAFLGVNTEDEAQTALAFARKNSVSYPSVLDAKNGEVRLAFAGNAAPSATPTTLVLDKEGRVAARVLGQIEPSTIDAVIERLLAEA